MARRSPLLKGSMPEFNLEEFNQFNKDPSWDAVPSTMELAGEIPFLTEDQGVDFRLFGVDGIDLDKERPAEGSPQVVGKPEDAAAGKIAAPPVTIKATAKARCARSIWLSRGHWAMQRQVLPSTSG